MPIISSLQITVFFFFLLLFYLTLDGWKIKITYFLKSIWGCSLCGCRTDWKWCNWCLIVAIFLFFLWNLHFSWQFCKNVWQNCPHSVFLLLQLYETANKYHFYHSLALLGAAHSGRPVVVSVEAKCNRVSSKWKWCGSTVLTISVANWTFELVMLCSSCTFITYRTIIEINIQITLYSLISWIMLKCFLCVVFMNKIVKIRFWCFPNSV